MWRIDGQGQHGLAYDPTTTTIYEVNHPRNKDGQQLAGSINWLEGIFLNSVPANGFEFDERKSVAYKWNLSNPRERAAFWQREKGSVFMVAPVILNNPIATRAWFASQGGKSWDYNVITNNCSNYAVHGLNLGGAKIGSTLIDPRPSQIPLKYTMTWTSGAPGPLPIK